MHVPHSLDPLSEHTVTLNTVGRPSLTRVINNRPTRGGLINKT